MKLTVFIHGQNVAECYGSSNRLNFDNDSAIYIGAWDVASTSLVIEPEEEPSES